MSKLRLDDVEWGVFYVYDIFEIYERGKRLKIDEREIGKIPFVTAGESNNGISSFIYNIQHKKYENAITIDMFGNAFYQDGKFKCDDNITILKNNNFSKNIYLFLTSRLNILNKKYSYGNQLRPNRLSRDKILLPIDSKGNPNWQFMEDYVKQEMKEQSQKIISYYENKLLKLAFELLDLEVEWKEFKLEELFYFKRGNQNNMSKCIDGTIPLVSAKKIDNGIKTFIEKNNKKLYPQNILTLNNDGDGGVGLAFYQPFETSLDTHVTALIPMNNNLTEFELLFLSMSIEKQKDKFSHGYSLNNNRLSNQKIMLPTDKNGNPHWEYMRLFMQKLEKENIEKVLEYIYIYIYIY